MHSKDGVRIVYARPASFQIQNGGCVIRVYGRPPSYFGVTTVVFVPRTYPLDFGPHKINIVPRASLLPTPLRGKEFALRHLSLPL